MTGARAALDPKLAETLVLDELFDLTLYTALHDRTTGPLRAMLDELVRVETTHYAFWQKFFGTARDRLDLGRRTKLRLLLAVCRVFGVPAIRLVLEAIEVYGVRKYLSLWDAYRGGPLGEAVRGILEDELKHEDQLVGDVTERRINPERLRDIFLGLNDGLVEMLGAVSGFFGAFGNPAAVFIAGLTTAVAGAFSMGAGAYVAASSEHEVARTERRRRRFLGEAVTDTVASSPWTSALFVGLSYLAGALVPVLPIAAGAQTLLLPFVAAGALTVVVSLVLAFLSGMKVMRRVLGNVVILAVAVAVTYAIGLLVKLVWGIAV